MRCSRCNRELTEDQSYVSQGKIYCEDCLMDIGLSIKDCDPWATYIETSGRKRHGEKGAADMTELETNIYDYIKGRGRATREEVMRKFGLSPEDLKLQLLPLMHSELVKERSEKGQQYLVTIA
jgi:hypothetical protein